MSGLKKIQRIKASQLQDFLRDHIQPALPVIITDLYASEKITRIQTVAAMKSELGDIMLTVGKNYYDQAFDKNPKSKMNFRCRMDEYLNLIEEDPSVEVLCREQPTPPKMLNYFNVPELAKLKGCAKPKSLMYAAKGGLVAPLHFDFDLCEVLFTQVVGKKRIFLVDPKYSVRLIPLPNMSSIPVHKFDEGEKLEFFGFNHAYECTLEPGETLYMPKLWWHYLENIGTTVAFNLRFGLTPFDARLRMLPGSYKYQNLARALVDPVEMRVTHEEVYHGLFQTYYKQYSSPEKREQIFENYVDKAFRELCKDAVQVPYGHLNIKDPGRKMVFKPLTTGRGDLLKKCSKADLKVLHAMIKKAKMHEAHVRAVCSEFQIDPQFNGLNRLDCHVLLNRIHIGTLAGEFQNVQAEQEQSEPETKAAA